jgi:hypothetical protein
MSIFTGRNSYPYLYPWGKLFMSWDAYPMQSHHDTQVCTPGLAATLGGDEMDSTLEYM